MSEGYAVVVLMLAEDDGGGYVSYAPDLPGCMADGETRQEATANIEFAISDWLAANEDAGWDAPLPGTAAQKSLDRERSMLGLIHELTAENEEKDLDISKLRTRVAHLLALLNDETGDRSLTVAPRLLSTKHGAPKRH